MSSKLPARLAVDANPMVSAAIGGKARRVFEEGTDTEFLTTAFTTNEVRQYLPALVLKRGVSLEDLQSGLDNLPVILIPKDAYQHRLPEAQALIQDPDDVELLALALELKVPIWTKDSDFNPSGIECYRTGNLLRMLDTENPRT